MERKKTNILLVNPPYDIQRYMGGLSKVGWVFPPIGLLYIASYMREKVTRFNIKIYDAQIEKRNFETVLKKFRPKIVGITCQTALVYSALDTAKIVKKILPESKVIIGGVHATLRPGDIISSDNVDYVVRGEGEKIFTELSEAILFKKQKPEEVKGVTYKKGKEIVNNPERSLTKNIDEFPMPALDLLPMDKYKISPDMKTGNRLGVILTSRGCPFNCMFCANKLLTKRTYRLRSIKSVLDEIDYYVKHYNIDQLMIYDDNFSVNKKRTIELCNAFIERGYHKKFTWWAEARVDCVDEEVLTLMKRAGCTILSFGLESGSQRLLDLIGKRIKLDQVRKTVKIIHKVGIDSRASFILGLPTETKEESWETIKFSKTLPLSQVRFAIATPFPGTELWDYAVKEGKINPDEIDWTTLSLMGGYTDYDPPYYPEGRTAKEMKRLQRWANMSFFLQPRIIWGFMKRMRSLDSFYSIVKGFFYFVKSTFSR